MLRLTRDEAIERAGLITVDHYAIELDLTAASSAFISTTTIIFRCDAADDQHRPATFVDLAAESVIEATLNGEVIDIDQATVRDAGRLPVANLRRVNHLRVRARMAYSTAVEGIHRFVDPADREVYLYAQAGPDYARNIFACFDQPDLKARIGLTVLAPPDWIVRANTSGQRAASGCWEFPPTQPISTYLMTVVAGPYYAYAAGGEHDGIPLGLLCRRSLAPLLDQHADEILRVTRSCFDRYHELFGIRYPFGKYDQVFVPEFTWGAVENPGCVTFREEMLFRSEPTRTELIWRAMVIAHEMAHMWFGDLVTLRWWDDIWLNESFAEYLGWRVTAEATEYGDAWTCFAVSRKASGYLADQRPSTHPVAPDDVHDVEEAMSNFDGISYAKGASVLHQLVVWLGDDDFLAGLRAFFAAHAFANATLSDLLAALSTASGRDLDAWAQVWLRTPEVDTVFPQVTIGEDGCYREVMVTQTAPPRFPVPRPHHIGVANYVDGLAQHRAEIDLLGDGQQTPVAELVGQPAGQLLLLNDGDLSFVKVRFDERSLSSLASTLPTVVDSLARAVVWRNLTEAVRDAWLPARDYLALVASVLVAERHPSIVESVLTFAIDVAAKRFAPAQTRPAALASLALLCERMIYEGPRMLQIAAARGLLSCAAASDVDRLDGWLAGRGVPPGLHIDADLRWAITLRLAVVGAVGEAEVAAECRRDHSARGEQNAARCRGAIADEPAKERAWRAITGSGDESIRLRESFAEGFWQSEQSHLTAGYVSRYFELVPDLPARHGANIVVAIASGLFPRYAVTPETVVMADTVLARDDVSPAIHRVVSDAADDLRRAVAGHGMSEERQIFLNV